MMTFTVLVVESDPDKLMLLRIALQTAGYEVRTAFDGEEGLAKIDAHMPDLIITATSMPRIDGYELARRVRANPQTKFIPIVIQTAARGDAQDIRRGAEVGALGFITDPTDLDLLLSRIKTLLDFKGYLDLLEEVVIKGGLPLPPHIEQKKIAEDKRRSIEIVQRKSLAEDYDVFLCHNNKDKEAVKEIALQLQDHAILPWLDVWQLQPGLSWQEALERQISKIKSAAVFVGSNGIGPWQKRELNAFLNEFVNRGCPVIPVLLSDVSENPSLPNFLSEMTWVDFRQQDPDPLDQLIWGITGTKKTK